MNARPLLLAILISGGVFASAAAAAQDLVEYALDANHVQVRPATGAFGFDCALTFKEGGQTTPVRVNANSLDEAQRKALDFRTPTGAAPTTATCAVVRMKP